MGICEQKLLESDTTYSCVECDYDVCQTCADNEMNDSNGMQTTAKANALKQEDNKADANDTDCAEPEVDIGMDCPGEHGLEKFVILPRQAGRWHCDICEQTLLE